MLFSGKIAGRLTVRYWVPNFCHSSLFPPVSRYLTLIAIRDCSLLLVLFVIRGSRLFETIRTIRTIRYSRLFAIRVSQKPNNAFLLTNGGRFLAFSKCL